MTTQPKPPKCCIDAAIEIDRKCDTHAGMSREECIEIIAEKTHMEETIRILKQILGENGCTWSANEIAEHLAKLEGTTEKE